MRSIFSSQWELTQLLTVHFSFYWLNRVNSFQEAFNSQNDIGKLFQMGKNREALCEANIHLMWLTVSPQPYETSSQYYEEV